MLDKAKFRAAMAIAETNQRELAQKLGITENTMTAKINGPSCFDVEEVEVLCECLNLRECRQKAEIFLA